MAASILVFGARILRRRLVLLVGGEVFDMGAVSGTGYDDIFGHVVAISNMK